MDNTAQAINNNGYIDSHQHFWIYHPQQHDWITDEMAVIRKDFLPAHLEPVLRANGITGCIAIQADQTETETELLLSFARTNYFISGVVGWVDLLAENLNERLQYFKQFPKLKGFRHILQAESPAFMLQPGFLKGIAELEQFGFTYDILIFPKHLEAAIELVKQFPNQRFVIDHIAKPYIKDGLMDEWKKQITAIAQYPNVYCKISGMVTEAGLSTWKPEAITPYIDVVVAAFGMKRIMYGSDWPVCLTAASYGEVLNVVKKYFAAFSKEEQALFFRDNAIEFYGV